MRVIAGLYGGRVLKSPPDRKTRPTSDRLKETLFNILVPRIGPDTRFLDLCAGTGAIGIEAISRGVRHATFVDKSRRACALVERNLDLLGISEDTTEVYCNTAARFLSKHTGTAWNAIYLDPPYDHEYADVLASIGDHTSNLLEETGVLIVEHHSKKIIPDEIETIRRWRLLKQGESCLSFYEQQ